jgi:hypothetical protein
MPGGFRGACLLAFAAVRSYAISFGRDDGRRALDTMCSFTALTGSARVARYLFSGSIHKLARGASILARLTEI